MGLFAALAASPEPYHTDFRDRVAVLADWTPQEKCAHCSGFDAAARSLSDKDECTNMTIAASARSEIQTP